MFWLCDDAGAEVVFSADDCVPEGIDDCPQPDMTAAESISDDNKTAIILFIFFHSYSAFSGKYTVIISQR